jgi:membrane protease YdiL (CAAX protease family)
MPLEKNATPEVPFSGAWAFLAMAFGMIALILVILLTWADKVEQLFGPLRASHPLFILAVWSPALSAWTVILCTTGWSGFRGYLTRLRVWRCGPYWAIFIIVLIPLIYYMGAWLKGEPGFTVWPFESLSVGFAAIGLMAVLGPIEEFGWRDLLQPLLQRRFVPFAAALIVGFIWGIWHLPAFFLSGLPQSNWDVIPFLIGVIAISVIITPLFNATRGGILLPMIFHFQLNNPMWPDALPLDIPFWVLAAIIVTVIYRKEMFDLGSGVKRVTALDTA